MGTINQQRSRAYALLSVAIRALKCKETIEGRIRESGNIKLNEASVSAGLFIT